MDKITVQDFVHKPDIYWGRREIDKSCCAYSVHEEGRGGGFHQCVKRISETIDGFGFCKVHAQKVKRRLGIVVETTTRFAAKFIRGDFAILELQVSKETPSTITVEEIKIVLGDSDFGIRTGTQRKDTPYTNVYKFFDDIQSAMKYLRSKAQKHVEYCEKELEDANRVLVELLN